MADTEWIFPAPTRSGHIEESSLKKQHPKACTVSKVAEFPLYTFRHTCLTRWAAHMDPYTSGYLAGHSDFSTTRLYVHPQAHTVREAMEGARNGHDNATLGTDTAQSGLPVVLGGHKTGHDSKTAVGDQNLQPPYLFEM